MASPQIRVGIIGAGKDARINLVPGFKAMEGVEVVSICNRSRESSQRAADEFGIPKVYDNWLDLIEADDTNAICIGTFPNTHATMTVAALENNKHVLVESRMARTTSEAYEMMNAARRKPHLTTLIVPSPATFPVDNLMLEKIRSGYLGDLLAVDYWSGRSIDNPVPGGFLDFDLPLDWRQDWHMHGYHAQGLAISYENMMRWTGPATRVMANSKVFRQTRRAPDGSMQPVILPDHIDVICDLACGAQAHLTVSQATGMAPSIEAWLFGTEGTIHITSEPLTTYEIRDINAPSIESTTTDKPVDAPFRDDVHYRDHHALRVYGARKGETEMQEFPNPVDSRYRWRAAEEFIRAIRGQEQVTRTSFETGIQYMEFVEAVARSARSGRAYDLPF